MKHRLNLYFFFMIIALCALSSNSRAASIDNNIQRETLPSIALTFSNAAAILPDGTLWAWGSGEDGALGNGRTRNSNKPVFVDSGVVSATICSPSSVFPGDDYFRCSLFYVKKDNTLWACGDNGNGILLNDTKKKHLRPIKIMEDVENVYSICHGVIFAQKTDGSLWGWGARDARCVMTLSEELEDDFVKTPILLDEGPLERDYILSVLRSYVLRNSFPPLESYIHISHGTLYVKGLNKYGMLGVGDDLTVLEKTRVMDGVRSAALGETLLWAIDQHDILYAAGTWDGFETFEIRKRLPKESIRLRASYRLTPILEDVHDAHFDCGTLICVKNDGTVWRRGANVYVDGFNDIGKVDKNSLTEFEPVRFRK